MPRAIGNRTSVQSLSTIRNIVGTITKVPGAHVPVKQVDLPPVGRAGDILVDDADFSRRLRGLDPRRDGELREIEQVVVRGLKVIARAVEAESEACLRLRRKSLIRAEPDSEAV